MAGKQEDNRTINRRLHLSRSLYSFLVRHSPALRDEGGSFSNHLPLSVPLARKYQITLRRPADRDYGGQARTQKRLSVF